MSHSAQPAEPDDGTSDQVSDIPLLVTYLFYYIAADYLLLLITDADFLGRSPLHFQVSPPGKKNKPSSEQVRLVSRPCYCLALCIFCRQDTLCFRLASAARRGIGGIPSEAAISPRINQCAIQTKRADYADSEVLLR